MNQKISVPNFGRGADWAPNFLKEAQGLIDALTLHINELALTAGSIEAIAEHITDELKAAGLDFDEWELDEGIYDQLTAYEMDHMFTYTLMVCHTNQYRYSITVCVDPENRAFDTHLFRESLDGEICSYDENDWKEVTEFDDQVDGLPQFVAQTFSDLNPEETLPIQFTLEMLCSECGMTRRKAENVMRKESDLLRLFAKHYRMFSITYANNHLCLYPVTTGHSGVALSCNNAGKIVVCRALSPKPERMIPLYALETEAEAKTFVDRYMDKAMATYPDSKMYTIPLLKNNTFEYYGGREELMVCLKKKRSETTSDIEKSLFDTVIRELVMWT